MHAHPDQRQRGDSCHAQPDDHLPAQASEKDHVGACGEHQDGGAKVGLLEQGATVTIFQSTPDGWMRIGANQWVFSKYIQEV